MLSRVTQNRLSLFTKRAVTQQYHSVKSIENLSTALSCYNYNAGYCKAKEKGYIDLKMLANHDITKIKSLLNILFCIDYSDKSLSLLNKKFFSIHELLECSPEQRDDYISKEICNGYRCPSLIGITTLACFLEKQAKFSLDETINEYHRDRSSTPSPS